MRGLIPLAGVLALVTAGCDRSPAPAPSVRDDVIIVGSFDLSESDILAEVYALAWLLENGLTTGEA